MNKKKQSFVIKIIAMCLLAGFCYYQAYSAYSILQRNFYCVSVRLQDQAVTKKQLDQAQETMTEQAEEHIPEIAAYSMTANTEVVEPQLERSSYVTLYQVYGQMKQVTPSELTAGNYVSYEDYAGCIIDEDTAFALFGTTNAVNQIVTVAEKEYYIRGVIESETPILMIEEKAEDTQFWNLELDYGNLRQGREYATQFLNNYGLSYKFIIIEQNFIADCIGNLLVLPVLILSIVVVVYQIRKIRATMRGQYQQMNMKAYRMKKDWMQFFVHVTVSSIWPLFLVAASIALFVVVWNRYGLFPMRYFPSKWSDFEQYVSFYNEIKSHLGDLSYVTPTRREVLLKQHCMHCIFFSVAVLFMEWHIMDLVIPTIGKGEKSE